MINLHEKFRCKVKIETISQATDNQGELSWKAIFKVKKFVRTWTADKYAF